MQAQGFRDLLRRAQAGDRAAMNQVLAAVRPDLLVRARHYVTVDQPEASASDLVQNVCLRAWQNLAQFRGGADDEQTLAQFRGWVLRILQCEGLNAIRFRSAQRRKPPKKHLRVAPGRPNDPSDTPNGFEPAADQSTPSARVRAGEEAALVREALERVPGEVDRVILQLRFFEGLSLRQIAARLQLSEDKVRERCHFTLCRLERELGGLL